MNLMNHARNQMDDLWFRVKTKAGYCSTSSRLADAKDYLAKADGYAKLAYGTAAFVARDQAVAGQLEKAIGAIGAVKTHVDAVDRTCGDVAAIGRMGEAIAVLNGWAATPPTRTPDEAAAAFDLLFGAAGRFSARLPFPVNTYAPILEAIGISRFFSGMRVLLDPERRPSGGRQMRAVLEELDRQGRGG